LESGIAALRAINTKANGVSRMGLFKADFFRFFALGFAAGAVLVFTTLDSHVGSNLAQGVVPTAEAAPAR
jgi:hypothetical protein